MSPEPGRGPASGDYRDFFHTERGTLAGEFLRRFWQPIYRSADLPVARPVPLHIMNERFTLYRGESGGTHLVDYRCAHRRTQLSLGWVEGDCIRCFYHGWKYDGAGQCVEQPAESEGFASKVRIASYPTREYLGLVFAYLGDGEPPELPRHPEFEAPGVLEVITFIRPCNYFNHIELDPTHIAFVHRDSPEADAGLVGVPAIEAHETDFGITIVAERAGSDGTARKQVQHRLMPNISVFKVVPHHPDEVDWRDRIAWRVPIDNETYASFIVDRVYTANDGDTRQRPSRGGGRQEEDDAGLIPQVLRGTLDRRTAENAASNVVLFQDDLALVGQGPTAEREHDLLTEEGDAAARLMREIWARELKALHDGEDLTHWQRPERLVGTAGV